MSILDKVRDAIKKNSKNEKEDEKKEDFRLSGLEEDKIREFEKIAEDMKNIIGKLEGAEIDTGGIREKIKNVVREII